MTIFNLSSESADLSTIGISRKTEAVPTNELKMLFPFGTHDVGLLRFKGSTPWEEHSNNEFLLVVEGETTLTLRTEQDVVSSTAKREMFWLFRERSGIDRMRLSQ